MCKDTTQNASRLPVAHVIWTAAVDPLRTSLHPKCGRRFHAGSRHRLNRQSVTPKKKLNSAASGQSCPRGSKHRGEHKAPQGGSSCSARATQREISGLNELVKYEPLTWMGCRTYLAICTVRPRRCTLHAIACRWPAGSTLDSCEGTTSRARLRTALSRGQKRHTATLACRWLSASIESRRRSRGSQWRSAR